MWLWFLTLWKNMTDDVTTRCNRPQSLILWLKFLLLIFFKTLVGITIFQASPTTTTTLPLSPFILVETSKKNDEVITNKWKENSVCIVCHQFCYVLDPLIHLNFMHLLSTFLWSQTKIILQINNYEKMYVKKYCIEKGNMLLPEKMKPTTWTETWQEVKMVTNLKP